MMNRDIRFNFLLKAPPNAVYQALTSARELTRWWLEGAETDARNAGKLRFVWPKIRGQNSPGLVDQEGVFVDLEPERKVAWLLKPTEGNAHVPPLVSIFIEGRKKQTEITLLHTGFNNASNGLYETYSKAWEDGLAKLKIYLETGRTCKSELMDLEAAKIISRKKR